MKKTLHIGGMPVTLEDMAQSAQEVRFTLSGKDYAFRACRLPGGGYALERETAPGIWQRMEGNVWQDAKGQRHVRVGAVEATISENRADAAHASTEAALSPTAPMPGLVRQILVKKGDRVTSGQPLAVMEAMKLQLTLSAGGDGVVEALLAAVGDMVSEGAELVKLAPMGK